MTTRSQMNQNAGAAEPNSQVQGQYLLDEIKNEITRLTGRIEDLERKSAAQENTAELKTKVETLENQVTALIEQLEKLEDQATKKDPEANFREAKEMIQGENYPEAQEKLTQYLKTPGIKHPVEGLFLRGETLFNSKKYREAILDYDKIREKHPNSSFSVAALYKIALSFEGLGMPEDARAFYVELVDKYPKSP